MVTYPNFWIQWDYQLGTFRGSDSKGKIYGNFTGQFLDPLSICAAMNVVITAQESSDLTSDMKQSNLNIQIASDTQASASQLAVQIQQSNDQLTQTAAAALAAQIAQDIANNQVVVQNQGVVKP